MTKSEYGQEISQSQASRTSVMSKLLNHYQEYKYTKPQKLSITKFVAIFSENGYVM